MNENFNTGWDPYQQLLTAEHNIMQLATAYNENQTIMRKLDNAYKHQQEVIQQLMFQNQKINSLLTMQRSEMSRLRTEIELLKTVKPNTQT